MTRRATVTKAAMRRVYDVAAERGKTVARTIVHPDGSWEAILTNAGDADLPSADQAEAEWDRALGLQS